MKIVWIMNWTEYEFGFRPDGTSMHVSLADADAFRKKYETGTAEQHWEAEAPKAIEVSDEKYDELVAEGGSMWATNTAWLKV